MIIVGIMNRDMLNY